MGDGHKLRHACLSFRETGSCTGLFSVCCCTPIQWRRSASVCGATPLNLNVLLLKPETSSVSECSRGGLRPPARSSLSCRTHLGPPAAHLIAWTHAYSVAVLSVAVHLWVLQMFALSLYPNTVTAATLPSPEHHRHSISTIATATTLPSPQHQHHRHSNNSAVTTASAPSP